MAEIAKKCLSVDHLSDPAIIDDSSILEVLFDAYELPAIIIDEQLSLIRQNKLFVEKFDQALLLRQILPEPFHIVADILPKALCETETVYDYLCIEDVLYRVGTKALKYGQKIYYLITLFSLKNRLKDYIPTELEQKISNEIDGIHFRFYCVGQRIELEYKSEDSILKGILACSFEPSLLIQYLDSDFIHLFKSFTANPLVESLPIFLKWRINDDVLFYTKQEILQCSMDENGCYVLEGMLHDVTSKIKERSSYRFLEGKLYDFIDHYNSGLLWITEDPFSQGMKVSSSNNRALSLLGYDKSNVIGKNIIELFPDIYQKNSFCSDNETVCSFVSIGIDVQNKERLYNVYVYPFPEFSMWGISFYEVPEADRTLLITSKKEVNLDCCHDLPDLIIKVDKKLRVVYANDAVVTMLGKSKSDLIGASYKDVFLSPLNIDNSILIRAIHTGDVIRSETKVNYQGENYDIEFYALPSISDDGEADSAILIGKNMTHFRSKEYQLQLENNHLKEMNQLKSQFFANMNHEVRTPLNSILGFMELLNDEFYSSEERLSFQQSMRENGDYLLNIIDDILDISAIEVNAITPNFDVVNVSSLLTTVYKSFEYKEMINLDIDFSLELEEESIFVYSDERILRRVITNVLNNAWKFTKEGSICVKLESEVKGVTVTICDTGCGICTDDLPYIFDRFRKFTNNYCKSFGGSGLGLSISQHFMHLIRGDISVISKEDKGSCFSIFIPHTIVEED